MVRIGSYTRYRKINSRFVHFNSIKTVQQTLVWYIHNYLSNKLLILHTMIMVYFLIVSFINVNIYFGLIWHRPLHARFRVSILFILLSSNSSVSTSHMTLKWWSKTLEKVKLAWFYHSCRRANVFHLVFIIFLLCFLEISVKVKGHILTRYLSYVIRNEFHTQNRNKVCDHWVKFVYSDLI